MKWEDVEARKAIRRLTGFLRGDAFPLLKADLSNKGIDTGRALLARWERTGEGRFQGLVASHDDELFSFGWTRLEGRGQTTSWRPWGQDEAIVGEVDGGARLRRNIRLMLERVGEAPAAREARLVQAEAELGIRFPDDYRADVCQRDGAELWMPSGAYLQLCAIDELVCANDIPQTDTHDGLVVFGNDGSRELFGFDFRREPPPVVMVCITSPGWIRAVEQAATFAAFSRRMESEGADFGVK